MPSPLLRRVRVLWHRARMPLLRRLRGVRWYRRLAHLPSNVVVSPLAYVILRAARAHGGDVGERVSPLDGPTTLRLTPPRPHEVPPPASSTPPAPSAAAPAAAPRVEAELPATWVVRLRDARLVGRGVAVLGAGDEVLADVTVNLNGPLTEHGVFRRFRLPEPRRLRGVSAVLSSPGGNTYYHWLLDVLPRLELLRRAGVDPRTVDHLVVNSLRHPFQRETLAWLGIDPARVVSSDAQPHLRCEEMLLPSFAAPSGLPPRWVIEHLAALVPPLAPPEVPPGAPATAAPERIYVSRQRASRRRLHEAAALEAALAARGFTTVQLETMPVAEQARLFRGARVIVGVHGSGFANLVFARPGAALVELFHPAQVPDYYWVLSRQVDVSYGAVVGRAAPGSTGDLVVDAAEVLRVLDGVSRGRHARTAA